MADRYAELRAALAAGPKPGKWTWKQVGSFNTPGCAVFWPDTSKGGVHYRRLDSGGGMEQVDAAFVAACHPEAIRTLLADADRATALEAANARLREMLQRAFQRGYQSGQRGLREMYDAVQAVKRQDAWGNTQLTEALLAAEERAEKAEAERSALLAERDVFADVLEAIASIKATPGRAKADALLASVVNLARAALAQGEA